MPFPPTPPTNPQPPTVTLGAPIPHSPTPLVEGVWGSGGGAGFLSGPSKSPQSNSPTNPPLAEF